MSSQDTPSTQKTKGDPPGRPHCTHSLTQSTSPAEVGEAPERAMAAINGPGPGPPEESGRGAALIEATSFAAIWFHELVPILLFEVRFVYQDWACYNSGSLVG